MAQLDLKNVDVFFKDGYAGSVVGTTLINHVLADPVSAPTATATGGGATGGSLVAGDYLLSYSYVTALGETLRSPDSSTLTVGSTNIPRVTFPALPSGAVSRKLYISTASGNRASETLYASGITTLTYDMAIAAPGSGAFLTVSTGGLNYSIGTTVILVDGNTAAATVGDLFTVGAETTVHTVAATTETLGATTSITFTPALTSVIADNAAIVWLPHQLQVRIGEGNLQWTEKRAVVYTKDRGILDTVKLGDQDPVEVKLDATWVFLKASSGRTPTIEDVLKHRGEAATWVTSSSDACEPYAVDLVAVYTPPCTTDQIETYTLNDFRYEDIGHDLKTGQLSLSGKCNTIEATVSRG